MIKSCARLVINRSFGGIFSKKVPWQALVQIHKKIIFRRIFLEAIHIFTDEWFEFEFPRILAVQLKSSDDCDEIRKKFDRYAHNYEIFLQNMSYTLRLVDDHCVDMAIAEELRRPYWSEYHHKKFQNFVESNI